MPLDKSDPLAHLTDQQKLEILRKLIAGMFLVLKEVLSHVILMFQSPGIRIPYHTSILTGEGWVLELLHGHPNRIKTELGVYKEVFEALVAEISNIGAHSPDEQISVQVQVAIFLYIAVTGITIRHAAERFQHTTATISK